MEGKKEGRERERGREGERERGREGGREEGRKEKRIDGREGDVKSVVVTYLHSR